MSERRDRSDFGLEVFEEEEKEDKEMGPEEVSNAYFLLDLNIPSPKKDAGAVQIRHQSEPSSSLNKLHKFGFLELLEKIHGKDLRTNNPWLNPAASRVHWKAREKKQVRFSTTEINSKRAELPYCRKKGDPVIKPGQLHAPNCRNAAQETVEVLGDHVWQNRVFILDAYMRNALHSFSRSRDNSESEGEDEDGYYKARAESLEELGVFDSVELAKQRLSMMPGRDDIQDTHTDAEQPTTSSHDQEKCQGKTLPLLHPDTANLNLELGSPISDEDCPTTASTLKHLSDHAYTDSPDNVFVWPHHSADSNSDSQSSNQIEPPPSSDQGLDNAFKSTDNAFKSTENTFQFQMFEPPKFKNRLSHSDYGSEEADDNFHEHSDIDLADLQEKLPNIPAFSCSPERSEVEHPNKITVAVQPPTPSSQTTARSSSMRPDESARLRGTVKVAERSPVGTMMSGSSSTNAPVVPKNDTKIHRLTEFMFDTPSPND